MIPRMNTTVVNDTIRDALRHLRTHLRGVPILHPEQSTCSSVDDGYVTIHGVNVVVDTTDMTVIAPASCANMTDACDFLLDMHAPALGVTYLVISTDNSKVQMRLRTRAEDRAIDHAVDQFNRVHNTRSYEP